VAGPGAAPFHAEQPDRLWFSDITQHRTGEGWLYCAAVLDVYSRRIVGWSIADHLRTELVVDALEMACWRRRHGPSAPSCTEPPQLLCRSHAGCISGLRAA
jgi:transposase InsO family protein